MNNRCVEHVLEDNKWTVLVLIVSDNIRILGNSHMGIRAQQHHEHHSFHTKLLRHLNLKLNIATFYQLEGQKLVQHDWINTNQHV